VEDVASRGTGRQSVRKTPLPIRAARLLTRLTSVPAAAAALLGWWLGWLYGPGLALSAALSVFLLLMDLQRALEAKRATSTDESLRMASRLMEALRDVTGVDEVQQRILTHLLGELGWSRAALWALDRVGRHEILVPAAAVGFDQGSLAPFVYRLDRGADVMPRAVLDRVPMAIRNAADDWRCDQKLVAVTGLSDYLIVPLVAADQAFSVIILDAEGHREDMERFIPALERCAHAAALALENASLLGRVQQMAYMDGLTGLYNHRHFQEAIRQELDRANRFPEPLMHFSLVMADVDKFKDLNDTHGHQAGDAVLVQIGQIFRDCTRKVDLVARYGGEEFVALLPSTDKAGALVVAGRLRASVAEHPFALGTGLPPARVTVSVGVATFAEDGVTSPDIIRSADEGLYMAKKLGRNRVCCIKPPPGEAENQPL